MTISATSLSGAGYSWSIAAKAGRAGSPISRNAFDASDTSGTTGLTAADGSTGISSDTAFTALDKNHDGVLESDEQVSSARPKGLGKDPLTPNWADGISTGEMLAYLTSAQDQNGHRVAATNQQS